MQREDLRVIRKTLLLNTSLVAFSIAMSSLPAFGQGISEYGGLMGMPKNMPTGHQGALTNLYGAGSLNKITGSQSGAAGSALPPETDNPKIINM